MSQSVTSVTSPLPPTSYSPAAAKYPARHSEQISDSAESRHSHGKGSVLSAALESRANQHQINDKRSLKAFSDLSQSLSRALDSATQVDSATAEEEISRGGLRRIGKDFSKLFKGMGLAPQLAKQLSRSLTSALQEGGAEQIDLSVSMTRSVSIEAYQLQDSYQSNAEGTSSSSVAASGLLVSAVQTRTFDFSLNLTSGEFSISRSSSDSLSLSLFDLQLDGALAAEGLSDEEGDAAALPATADATSMTAGFEALVVNRSSLLEISQQLTRSPLVQSPPAAESEADVEAGNSAAEETMDGLYAGVDDVDGADGNLYQTLTRVWNLRIEEEESASFLRFNFASFAPVGLSALDENGYRSTLYPRPDGELGLTEQAPLDIDA